jgi:hypothetical protein
MHLERSCDALLGRQQASEVSIDLADVRIRAGNVDAVAVGRTGRAARKVIAFVGGKNEQGVIASDAIRGQASS